MPRTPAETRRLFDQWAAADMHSLEKTSSPMDGYDDSLTVAVAMMALCPGATLLDFGIGTGAFAALFAAEGARIWGVDISEQMLDQCRELHPDFCVTIGSFTPIPHDDEAFDAVVSSFAIHEIMPVSRKHAYAELARVLNPGGYICLLDIMFASEHARAEAKHLLGRSWDKRQAYALVGDLDAHLREVGFGRLQWRQTAPCHWVVVGRRLAW